MNKNLTMEEHFKIVKKKINYLISRINWIPNKHTPIESKVILWKSLIKPIILYGSIIMNKMKITYK